MIPRSSLPPHEAHRLWISSAGDPDRFARLESERLAGAPLQYLEGTAAFGPLDLVVDERVLIPRPETEQLWELAMALLPQPEVVIDLGTGSGALALGIKYRVPTARVLAVDASPEALDVSRLNAKLLGLEVTHVHSDLFDRLPADLRGAIDLIVSNPPYVAEEEWPDLPEDVRREPRDALVSGARGTEILERIAADAVEWLAPGGWLACEIGETQGAWCAEVFARTLADVEVRQDLTGRDRFVIGRRPA